MNLTEQPTATMGTRILSRAQVQHAYRCRMANSIEDIRAAQTLRFLVFNVEMNEGLEQSFVTCRDEDKFDDVCDHLLVEDANSGEIVGTYRLQTGPRALANFDYYSAQEFDFSPFEKFRQDIVELGRACVHSHHRNLTVLSLLWRGIYDYARKHGGRYLIGCSSLNSQDATVGARAFADLKMRHLASPEWQTEPLAEWNCSLHPIAPVSPKIPKLLSAYLSLGAKICAPPALDKHFKTIDFLTVLDIDALPESTVRRFLS